jgi:hypothetical protein
VRPLTADRVLARLCEAGVTEAASIAELGRSWGWKRERASKAMVRWQEAGHIERENKPDGTIVIRWRVAVHGDARREDTGNLAGPSPDDAAAGFTASFGGVTPVIPPVILLVSPLMFLSFPRRVKCPQLWRS